MISAVSGTINRLEMLKRMVTSVRESVGGVPYEIVLVDNDSTDGTPEWCAEQPDIVYLNIGEPQGSIPAFNLGFAHVSGKYAVTLNDDITVEGDTLKRAFQHLEENPHVGQVAFAHKYQNRAKRPKDQPVVQAAFGYIYGQCCMTRTWLGELAGWWGDEGMFHYGGDTRLSMRLWEMGWPTVELDGCAVIDYEVVDDTRRRFGYAPRGGGKVHPDLTRFMQVWQGRLPEPQRWIPAPVDRILTKAAQGNLRTVRFKGSMNFRLPMRTACIKAFGAYGPTRQIDKGRYVHHYGRDMYQRHVQGIIGQFKPDLVLFQAQGAHNSVTVRTVESLRAKHPHTMLINWDGDTHYPMAQYLYDIARAVHLQLTISPSLFPRYIAKGAPNIGYWPIGIEQEFIDVQRQKNPQFADVIFLGSLFSNTNFPEWETRNDAVLALSKSDLKFALYGRQWGKLGLKAQSTQEQFGVNPGLYAKSKMALSVSQSAELWGYTSDRLYNITATGCPALVQRFAGMDEHGYIDGETCIAWSTFKEMMDKARYYARHDAEREEIGARGREMTLSMHTWPHRVKGLFEMLGGI
jgi:GT2 family glycosyltransferase